MYTCVSFTAKIDSVELPKTGVPTEFDRGPSYSTF